MIVRKHRNFAVLLKRICGNHYRRMFVPCFSLSCNSAFNSFAMNIVLDANILIQDFPLKGANLVTVCKSISLLDGKVYVPEVAVRETVNKFREELDTARETLEKGIKTLNRISPFSPFSSPVGDAEIDKLHADYDTYLRERLKELGIDVLKISNIPHDRIIERDLARKKPFKTNGSGYRDTLIWENVKECYSLSTKSQAPHVVFVTQNHKDFCGNGYSLHDDFFDDLKSVGIASDDIRIVKEISDVIKEYIAPKQQAHDIKSRLVKDKKYRDIDLTLIVKSLVDEYALGREFSCVESPFGSRYDAPIITGYDEPTFTVSDVRLMSDEQVIIDLNIQVECDFKFYVDKLDPIVWDAAEEDKRPTIVEWKSKDYFVTAVDSAELELLMTLIVDKEFEHVISHDIELITTKKKKKTMY